MNISSMDVSGMDNGRSMDVYGMDICIAIGMDVSGMDISGMDVSIMDIGMDVSCMNISGMDVFAMGVSDMDIGRYMGVSGMDISAMDVSGMNISAMDISMDVSGMDIGMEASDMANSGIEDFGMEMSLVLRPGNLSLSGFVLCSSRGNHKTYRTIKLSQCKRILLSPSSTELYKEIDWITDF